MLSVLPSYAGMRENPASIAVRIPSSTVASISIATMSGRGSITSRTTRVAELEDRVDELALLVLDALLVGRDVGHRLEVLLGDERALLQPLARHHDVGEADEPAGEGAQGREVRDGVEEPGAAQRGAVGVLDRVRLRHDLGDDEEQHQLEHEADDDPDRPEVAVEQDARAGTSS